MPKQIEIDFSAGDEPRNLIRARIQDLVNTSLSENTASVPVPGKIASSGTDMDSKTSGTKIRRYTVSSLF